VNTHVSGADDTGYVLVARDVVKSYTVGETQRTALAGVSLSIPRRRFTAIMGPSGSGKSTLLHSLAGLVTPTSGDVILDGLPLRGAGAAQLATVRNTKVGFVFQAFNLVPVLDARENVALPGAIAGMRAAEARRRADDLLARVGLADRGAHLPAQLSGGEQQRVAVARALFMRPAVLLADEPTGNLDSAAGAGVLELFRSAHTDGETIVIVTHDPGVAAAAEEIILLRDGRLAGHQWLGRAVSPEEHPGRVESVLQWLAEEGTAEAARPGGASPQMGR
jgi:putative ABC transport system ATP-binding protein